VAAAGIDGTWSFIAVDDHLRAADGVWSVGDVTGAGAVTHVAMYQARIAASDILGQAHEPASYRALPRLTFTDPEVGAVGLTEAQARGRNVTVQTAVSPIPSSSRGWIHGPGNDGFIKLIADADAGMLIGATSAGPAGGEVLGALAVAVHAGVPVAMLSQMIYAYPTLHRAIEDAIAQLSLPRARSNHGPRHSSQGRAASVGPFPVPGQAVHRPLERAELATSCPCPHGNPMIATGPRYAAGKTSPPPAANTG